MRAGGRCLGQGSICSATHGAGESIDTILCVGDDSGYMPNAAEMVERIDCELSRDNPHAMFITLLLVVMNARSGEFEWCNAGHNPPCLLSAEGRVSVVGGDWGIPVGIAPQYFRNIESGKLPTEAACFCTPIV